jgi:hypothetical protein
MAIRKRALVEVGGFDPVYTAAGDDVDLCWRLLDRRWEIAFHPAALVWHHRRPSLRAYLRQQLGYGRSEALVEARHPNRFTATGTARWHGHLYGSTGRSLRTPRVYRGLYGVAPYQSVYHHGGHTLDLAHQLGVPAATLFLLTAPLALIWLPWLVMPALSVAGLAALATVDVSRARSLHRRWRAQAAFRLWVGLLHLLQPLARTWGRLRHRTLAHRDVAAGRPLPPVLRSLSGGVLLLPQDRSRAQLAADVLAHLRRGGLRVLPVNGWESHDGRLLGSSLVRGDLLTSGHPSGYVQLRVRRRLRWGTLFAFLGLAAVSAPLDLPAIGLLLMGGVEGVRGMWRTGGLVRRIIRDGAE